MLKRVKNFLGFEVSGSYPPHFYWWRSYWRGNWQLFLEQDWQHRPGVYRDKGTIGTSPFIQLGFGKGFIRYYPKGRTTL